MRSKTYLAYRESGVDWLGRIPEHWTMKRLKHVSQCLDGRRIPLSAEQRGTMQGEYPYWGANGVVDHVDSWLFDEEVVLLGEDGAPFFEPFKNVAFLVSGKIWVNNHAHVLRPKTGIISRYLTYLLNAVQYRSFIDGSTRDKLTQTDMDDIPVQYPPIHEQRAIAAFLDRETERIDTLIASKQRQIELLQEKRAALISHAVTTGLNPNVRMKDSGVEWLGEIPEHWEVKRLKHVSHLRSGDSITSFDIYETGDYPVYGGNGLRGYTVAYSHEGEFVLIGRQGALCGCINYAVGRFWASEHAVVATPIGQTVVRWLGELLRSMNLNRYSQSAAQPGLAVETIAALLLPVPPIQEQRSIAAYLDSETGRIDALISKVQQSIEMLCEYRSALISAAVTGKIDVRQEVA